MKDVDNLKLLESTILSKKDLLKNYKLIGFFGSCLDSLDFFDIDLVSIGDNDTHRLLRKEIKEDLSKERIKVIFFKTVKKQPLSKKDNEILIHDLHYSNLQDLYKKEWKDIINEIKKSTKVIYGSKESIKEVKVSDGEFLSVLKKWVIGIKTNKDYIDFKNYIVKTNKKISEIHPNLKLIISKLLKLLELDNYEIAKRELLELFKS
ncbi:MAG: hypothetical protein AABX30_01815 [Nanoarchaeota archaeon]